MTFSDATKQPVLRWGALIALLVSLTQFDKGLALVWSKWNADAVAGEAKKEAAGVRSDFDRYLDAEQQARELEQQRQTLQQEFNQRLVELQQQQAPTRQVSPNAPMSRLPLREYDDETGFWCCDLVTREACWEPDAEGRNAWVRCE